MKNTSPFSMVVLQPLLLCIRDGKFWGKGKGEGATSAVTELSTSQRCFLIRKCSRRAVVFPCPTAPPALHFQALSPGTWQAAHRNIRWQHFQHERRQLTPLDKREAAGGRSWEQGGTTCGSEGKECEISGGRGWGAAWRHSSHGLFPTLHSHRLSPVTPLGMLWYHCDGSSRDPKVTDRRRQIINTTAAVRHQQLTACHTKPCTTACDIPGHCWEHEAQGGREKRAAAHPLGGPGASAALAARRPFHKHGAAVP